MRHPVFCYFFQVCMGIVCFLFLPRESVSSETSQSCKKLSILKVLRIPTIWFSFMGFIVATVCNGFLSINLEPQVRFRFIVKSVSKWKLLLNDCSSTISGHFVAICTFIFHKAEVQRVILRCLMGLNFNWFKSYGLRCSLRPRASSANSQKIATDKWPCNDHTWPFFANYMCIFHKTEIQMVILRCLTSLNLNWYKSYDTKCKFFHFRFFAILYKNTFAFFAFLRFLP